MANDARRLVQACFDSVEEGRALLRREPALLGALTGLGETPLHYLVVEDQLEAVKMLVEEGAQINTLNRFGNSALAEAASLGYTALVDWMLANGAKLSLPGQSDPTLSEAVNGGHADTVRLLLEADADPNAADRIRYTPLHAAAARDKLVEIIPILVAAGAKIDRVGLFDETPLDHARSMRRTPAPRCCSASARAATSGRPESRARLADHLRASHTPNTVSAMPASARPVSVSPNIAQAISAVTGGVR